MRKSDKKCTCGMANKVFCPNCSKLKMVILLKNGYDHLKYERNGQLLNPTWYSILKYNRYDPYRIAEKMEENVRKTPLGQAANVLQFYLTNNRNHLIKKVVL